MKKYLELDVIIDNEAIGEMIIAQLTEYGFYGFLEEMNHLKAYHENCEYNDYVFFLKDLNLSFSEKIIEEENWNALWESSFEPVLVDDFALIRADFHEKLVEVKHDIVITPKMSFGTGHHATTLGMIKLMKETDLSGKKVMDFGTGTGILAILAEKCGASSVDAIDIDDWSIDNALENIAKNDCKKIKVWKDDGLPNDKSYDIILANINLHVLLASKKPIWQALKTGGTLIISGIMKKDESMITETYFELFGKSHIVLNINDWLMFIYNKK